MSLLNNNTFNRSLVSLAVGIGRDPQAFQANFNRYLQPRGRNQNNQQLHPAELTTQHGNDPIQQNEDDSEEPAECHPSDPAHLNAILFKYFCFERSEEQFEENEEFLQEVCDRTPSDDPEWRCVWKRDQEYSGFSQDEHTRRNSLLSGIWEDECFKRPVGPLYPHEEDYEELMREAKEMRRKMKKKKRRRV